LAGTYNPSTGSTSSDACADCAANTYSSVDASTSCTNCASGKTCPAGSTSCSAGGDDDTVTDDGGGGDDYYGGDDDTSPAPTVSAGSGCPGMLLLCLILL